MHCVALRCAACLSTLEQKSVTKMATHTAAECVLTLSKGTAKSTAHAHTERHTAKSDCVEMLASRECAEESQATSC